MNHSEVLGEVTSTAYPFLLMDGFLATNQVICTFIGIPLNLLTAALIVFSTRLHLKRNILWLGVAFSNILVLSLNTIEFYIYLFQCDTAKKIFSLMAGLPVVSLAMNLSLSLLDRYVSIAHSAWYKRNVTITWIVSGQIMCFSICVLTKAPYLFEIFPLLSPRKTFTELQFPRHVGFITVLLCLIAQIFVYIKLKFYLRFEKRGNMSQSTHRRAYTRKDGSTQTTTFIVGDELQEDSLNYRTTASVPQLVVTTSPFFIQISGQEISRLEFQAARHALDSVTLFLLFVLPSCVTLMFAIYADCLLTTFPIRQDCLTYLWKIAYARAFMMIYPVVNPVFFIVRSADLTQALTRRWILI